MQKLAKDVYVESGFAGVTVGAVLTSDGVICIDAPTHPADARRWRLKLAQLSPNPIVYVINLDHHRDRVLGNQWLEAPVIAHENTFERLRQLPELFKGGLSEAGADSDLAADLAGVHLVTPQITLSDRLILHKGGREIHLVHRPGSASGAIWVELPKEQIVFVGDSLTVGVPPPMHDANIDLWLDTLAELRKARYPARVIVPGRGSPTHKPAVRQMETFLRLVRRKVASLHRGRKTRADAVGLAEVMVRNFSMPASMREHYTRRLRAGLEYLYDQQAGIRPASNGRS